MKAWWGRVTSGWDKQSRAEKEVQKARERVKGVTSSIATDIAEMERTLLLRQAMLQKEVQQGAPSARLITATKAIKQLQKQIEGKKKLMGNMSREERQLTDTYTNTQVASAMMESVDAQKKMQKLCLGGRDEEELEDVLDEIDEHREATNDLSDRLAAFGGDDDGEVFDESAFGADDVVSALGMRTNPKDDILIYNIGRQMAAEWQNTTTMGGAPHSAHLSNTQTTDPLNTEELNWCGDALDIQHGNQCSESEEEDAPIYNFPSVRQEVRPRGRASFSSGLKL